MRLKFILTILLPTMRLAVQLLRDKDENSTGADDILADQLDTALTSAENYVAS